MEQTWVLLLTLRFWPKNYVFFIACVGADMVVRECKVTKLATIGPKLYRGDDAATTATTRRRRRKLDVPLVLEIERRCRSKSSL